MDDLVCTGSSTVLSQTADNLFLFGVAARANTYMVDTLPWFV